MVLRDFVPPILGKSFRKRHAPESGFVTFRTYADAKAHCEGYEARELVEVVCAKTKRLRDRLRDGMIEISAAIAVDLCAFTLAARGSTLRVIDFGGACGAHYFNARCFLPRDLKIRWCVCETPLMASVAQSYFESDELSFHSTLSAARLGSGENPDLVFASGALQYTPDPLDSLAQLLDCRGRVFLLGRASMIKSATPITVIQHSALADNGPGPLPDGFRDREVEYPWTGLPVNAIESAIREDYAVRAKVRGHDANMSGVPYTEMAYLCDRL